jgi:predicted RNA-binding Zn-ribbon protein involved in translation (DUF1610 family)
MCVISLCTRGALDSWPRGRSTAALGAMFDKSVIARTGQKWKLALAIALVIAGAATLLIGLNAKAAGIAILGLPVAFAGMLFGGLAVRCPSCGNRWVWNAMSNQGQASWLTWLASQTQCPQCGKHGT